MRSTWFLALVGLLAFGAHEVRTNKHTRHTRTSYDFTPVLNKFIHPAPAQIM